MINLKNNFEYERGVGRREGWNACWLSSWDLKERACSTIERISPALRLRSDKLWTHLACKDSESAWEGSLIEPPVTFPARTNLYQDPAAKKIEKKSCWFLNEILH